jgi:hypothetical protein
MPSNQSPYVRIIPCPEIPHIVGLNRYEIKEHAIWFIGK